MKFEVGARVVRHFDRWNPDEDDTERGEVVGLNPKTGKLIVNWENWRGVTEVKEWDEATTLSEEDANAKLSKLEEEYNAVAKAALDKVTAAAKLLNEASAIADAAGLELASMHDAVRPMMSAMRGAGWRTSALHC